MAAIDDEPGAPPRRKVAHEVGQDLSVLSVDELEARVALLHEEIARLEREIAAKSAHMNAADLLFRR